MPLRYRRTYSRELLAWSLLPFMMGMLEGGVVGITAKKSFSGQVDPDLLNLVIGLLTGLPAMANLTSFAWAAMAHGRHKVHFIVTLQVVTILSIAAVGLAAPTAWGFVVFAVAVTAGRAAWAGVVTVRTTIWASNYPRPDRPRIAGAFASVQALCLALVTFLTGLLLDENPDAYRWVFPVAATVGLLGTLSYSRIRVRGHRRMLDAEHALRSSPKHTSPSINPLGILRLLRQDRSFASFMICLFLIGTGNIMVTAPLVIILDEQFNLDYVHAIAILTSIPILMMPLSIPVWSRLLARVHVVRFRSIHSWIFVITNFILCGAVLGSWLPGIYLAAVIRGIGFGGGVLAWNLGHHDFASPESSSQYMGVHVTLTGIRGLLAPILGVSAYEILIRNGSEAGGGVFFIAALLGILGATGFMLLGRRFHQPPGGLGSDPRY
ncbi:MAG: MFS transporter [Planctomycetota bacterium]|nr:MFS transporter [Planctomycetota bacterium]